MKKIEFIKYILLFNIVFCVSCNSDILNYDDPNSYDTQSYFKTPEEIQKSANAIYSGFYFNGLMGWKWDEMFDVLADEANPQPPAAASEPNIVAFWHYQFNGNNNCITGYWKLLYRLILRSNLTIDKGNEYLETHKDANTMVSQSVGEAHFLRGWAYTQLAFYWGRVPLRTQYDQTGNENAPRSETVEEVWAIAEADFKKAQSLLPPSWDDANIGRATSGAATGFLGKLYLYTKKYTEAETELAKMTAYSLESSDKWVDMFTERYKNSKKESVFELQFQYYEGSNGGVALFDDPEGPTTQVLGRSNFHPQLYGWNDWNNWYFGERRVKDFIYKDEQGSNYVDPRAELTFYEKAGGIGDSIWCDECPGGKKAFVQEVPYYKKRLNKEFKESENGAQTSNNLMMMRYADVILMRAECALKGTNQDVTKALSLINQVRKRINAFEYTKSYSADETFELLKRERQLELMGEYHRFNDLKRWGILKETMDPEMIAIGVSPIDPKYYLFPIPQTEIDSNIGLGTVSNGWN